MRYPGTKVRLRLIAGDITKVPADAIVNAANSELIGGGGVDGAIHRAGGPAIMEELNRIRPPGGCPAGSAVVTGAGGLPARWVIHAVGPIWRGGGHGEPTALGMAYVSSLRIAAEKGAHSVSFPSISTGAYGYPVEKAAPVVFTDVGAFLRGADHELWRITWVLFDAGTLAAYQAAWEEYAC